MNKYNIFIWTYGIPTFSDVANVFLETIRNKGYICEISSKPDESCKNIVFGANNVVHVSIPLPEGSVIVNLEQLRNNSMWSNGKYFDLLSQYEVWDYSDSNISFLNEKNITNIKKINIGYAPSLSTCGDIEVEKDIDVLFYGCMNPRRSDIFNILNEDQNLSVVFKNNCFGKERDQLIARSKVVLNIHYYESKVFEIIRVSHLLANGACVISEDGGDLIINKFEYDYWSDAVVFAQYDNLISTIYKYLQDDTLRREQARKGKEIMMSRPQILPISNGVVEKAVEPIPIVSVECEKWFEHFPAVPSSVKKSNHWFDYLI
jgi:hypothetical protein